MYLFFTQVAGITVILVSCLVLVGWTLDIQLLKSVHPRFVAMNPSTALAFILAGTSLWLLRREQTDQRMRHIGEVCAWAVALVGLLRLSGYLFGWDFGIDQLLFREKLEAESPYFPNRMAPNTSLNFLLLGLALILLDVETRYGRRPAQFLTLVAALISLGVVGYAYSIISFSRVASYIPMALNTALAFTVLCAGLLCARPDRGLMAIITSDSAGGAMARRLLPAVIVIPLALGMLVVEDNRDAAETLRDILEMCGHEVEVAYSGPAGVEAARQFRPEVVLCDVGLPGMDGYAVATELRQDPATASARLIAITGYGQEEDQRRSREAGFDLHLTKPVDPLELQRLLVEIPEDCKLRQAVQ